GANMRAFLATGSADRISAHVLSLAGVLFGVLVFFVAVPLALSNPYPTPKDSAWMVQRSTFELAAVSAAPAVIGPPLALDPETTAAADEVVAPSVKLASLGPATAEAAYVAPALAADPAPGGSIGSIGS